MAFFLNIISTFYTSSDELKFNLDKILSLISNSINSIFIIMALILLNKKIFSVKQVDSDIIKGGVSIFLLIGLLWTFFYQILSIFDPNAFSHAKEIEKYNYLLHFSFTTLTTLGYGDITPVNQFAMNLANLEAIVGVMYPSIFIARLVSLYTAKDLKDGD